MECCDGLDVDIIDLFSVDVAVVRRNNGEIAIQMKEKRERKLF